MENQNPSNMLEMLIIEAKVEDENGIHARPSAMIVKECISYPLGVYLKRTNSEEKFNCKGVLDVMGACIMYNEQIQFYIEFEKDKKQEAKNLGEKLKEITMLTLEEVKKKTSGK